MGRLNSALLTPFMCLAGLAACTAPPAPLNAGAAQLLAPPRNLIGATPQVLSAEFGQPALLRVDGAAQVWLYHSPVCDLNIFLYPDAAGVPRVTMATAADGSPAIGDCPASLLQSHIDAITNLPAAAGMAEPAVALEPPASS